MKRCDWHCCLLAALAGFVHGKERQVVKRRLPQTTIGFLTAVGRLKSWKVQGQVAAYRAYTALLLQATRQNSNSFIWPAQVEIEHARTPRLGPLHNSVLGMTS